MDKQGVINGLSGSVAGTISALAFYPLDVIRSMYQSAGVNEKGGKGSFQSIVQPVWRNEGWRAFYQGATPTVVGSLLAWGIYFSAYHTTQKFFTGLATDEGGGRRAYMPIWVTDFAAATGAGMVSSALTTPIWVIKVRLQLQRQGGTPAHSPRAGASEMTYRGLFDGLRKVAVHEGAPGLFKGLSAQLVMSGMNSIQFVIYEMLLRSARRHLALPAGSKLPDAYVFASSLSAKTTFAIINNPLMVAKVRIQEVLNSPLAGKEAKYTGVAQAMGRVVREEGPTGLMRGLRWNLVRLPPQSALLFVIYERVKHSIGAVVG